MITDATIWDEAREIWLAQLPANTRRSYALALAQLLNSAEKHEWEISKREIAQWVGSMRNRNLSPATITTRLAAVSSFFEFIINSYAVTAADGSQVSLRVDNPAAGIARPRVNPYNKAFGLDARQVRAILNAIPRDYPIGKRDYALFLGYIMTGRRNSEWRTLQYEDLVPMPSGMYYHWHGKNTDNAIQNMNPPVYEAIMDYARSEGREHLDFGYIFHSYSPRGEIIERPISAVYVRRSLKHYASAAGLDARNIHVHTLRHTAALLRSDAGDDVVSLREFLGHESIATTQIYLQRVQRRPDQSWQTVAEYIGAGGDSKF